MAEVDFVYQHNCNLIPIEVKSGATGRLRSLHQFMDRTDHGLAIRFYSGKMHLQAATTLEGKTYKLLNCPITYVLNSCGM